MEAWFLFREEHSRLWNLDLTVDLEATLKTLAYKRLEFAREELDPISNESRTRQRLRNEQKLAGNFKYERDTPSSDPRLNPGHHYIALIFTQR